MKEAPTNSKVFWDSDGPFGKFDDVHEMTAWAFTRNTLCKYYFLGWMGFIWDVPTDLNPSSTYRLRFTINSNSSEVHTSGPFRIQAQGSELPHQRFPSQAVLDGWMIYALALVGVAVMGMVVAKMRRRRGQGQGLIRL
jgi:hypothetical protein